MSRKTPHTACAASLLALSLAGCYSQPPAPGDSSGPVAGTVPASPAGAVGRCNAAPAQVALGRMADVPLQNEMQRVSGARIVRVLRPDQVVTMEYSGERLSLAVDRDGRINRVSCG